MVFSIKFDYKFHFVAIKIRYEKSFLTCQIVKDRILSIKFLPNFLARTDSQSNLSDSVEFFLSSRHTDLATSTNFLLLLRLIQLSLYLSLKKRENRYQYIRLNFYFFQHIKCFVLIPISPSLPRRRIRMSSDSGSSTQQLLFQALFHFYLRATIEHFL